MKTKMIAANKLDEAISLLNNGEIVAFPTETVFGLGVIYDNEEAFNRLVNVKRRKPDSPFTLMVAHTKDINKYAEIDRKTQAIIDTFLPGELTLILKVKKDVPHFVTLGTPFIGIRVSASLLVANLISGLGKPLLVPSANKSGEKPALTVEEVKKTFDSEISGIILGETVTHIPSTIIKIDDKITLVREGAIPFRDILKIAEEVV